MHEPVSEPTKQNINDSNLTQENVTNLKLNEEQEAIVDPPE